MKKRLFLFLIFCLSFETAFFIFTPPFYAEEGLWLLTSPPFAEIQKQYGAVIDSSLLIRLQKCVVRLDHGATGSFVSPDGLVLTNHHCVIAALNKLRTSKNDPLQNGFYAKSLGEEIPCPDFKLRFVLDEQDVTERFQEVYRDSDPSQVSDKIAQLTDSLVHRGNTEPDIESQVVHYYQGAQSFLIRYRCFNDVRLVFAPEMNVGFFGGETDNFEYPRYSFDAAFLRVYKDGKPYRPKEWLTINRRGADEGELTLTLGFPARSERFKSVRHLQLLRDLEWPYHLERCRNRQEFLESLRETHPDLYPPTAAELFGIQNSIKAARGRIASLNRPEIWGKKLKEGEQRDKIIEEYLANLPHSSQNSSKESLSNLDPREELNQGLLLWEANFFDEHFFVLDEAFDSTLYKLAKKIVLWTRESKKAPNDRLPDYKDDPLLQKKKKEILSHLTIREEIEKTKWIRSLLLYNRLRPESHRSPENDFFRGKTPETWGTEILQKTKIRDLDYRRFLVSQGWQGVQVSDDPLIQFALWVENQKSIPARERQKKAIAQINKAYRRLVPIYYRALAPSLTPDANFTLRLSYGQILGYQDDLDGVIPAKTTIGEAFSHAEAHQRLGAYSLSPKWFAANESLDKQTALNQISTNDILGGNSGSPLLNAQGELVGLIFDGNYPSLASDFLYSDEKGRAVSVASQGILEILQNVYHADRLLQELTIEESNQKTEEK